MCSLIAFLFFVLSLFYSVPFCFDLFWSVLSVCILLFCSVQFFFVLSCWIIFRSVQFCFVLFVKLCSVLFYFIILFYCLLLLFSYIQLSPEVEVTSRLGKYPPLVTNTEGDNCFSICQISE